MRAYSIVKSQIFGVLAFTLITLSGHADTTGVIGKILATGTVSVGSNAERVEITDDLLPYFSADAIAVDDQSNALVELNQVDSKIWLGAGVEADVALVDRSVVINATDGSIRLKTAKQQSVKLNVSCISVTLSGQTASGIEHSSGQVVNVFGHAQVKTATDQVWELAAGDTLDYDCSGVANASLASASVDSIEDGSRQSLWLSGALTLAVGIGVGSNSGDGSSSNPDQSTGTNESPSGSGSLTDSSNPAGNSNGDSTGTGGEAVADNSNNNSSSSSGGSSSSSSSSSGSSSSSSASSSSSSSSGSSSSGSSSSSSGGKGSSGSSSSSSSGSGSSSSSSGSSSGSGSGSGSGGKGSSSSSGSDKPKDPKDPPGTPKGGSSSGGKGGSSSSSSGSSGGKKP